MCINVCDASHIIPFSETLSFDVDNGILLNSILHRLFDKLPSQKPVEGEPYQKAR